MFTALEVLNACVAQVLINPPNHNHATLINNVVMECERLKGLLFDIFSKGGNVAAFASVLNVCQVSAIKLTNSLWTAHPENPVVQQALNPLVALTRHTEGFYWDLLNKSHALSAFEVQELRVWLDEELKEIEQRLRQTRIDESLIEQLMKAHTDFFKPEKYPALCYADRQYLEVFIPKLKAKAFDERKQDWNIELRQLLIKWNFNHMGIYKMLIAEIDKIVDIKNLKKKQQKLHEIDGWLHQVQSVPNIAYDFQIGDFKTLLLKRIGLLQEQLRVMIELETLIKVESICFKGSVHELALEFHYKYDEGVYVFSTKKAAAECILSHVRTEGTEEIALASFLKLDKLEYRPAATRLYQRYARITAKLKKDFDL
ncbi:hypothetical protein [Pedobacter nyackensis]|uniref:Uncharacterized protein n=1 Tax=Pedobacter nyackensis TaxID=475255 RepID=A0A1W2AHY1_9SPHI|nr:hypothetical protein [Pedobacter nyackensis]SMC60315.1 hypothetical protein SAMN04488101_101634 [Pedobacter nyackensis]